MMSEEYIWRAPTPARETSHTPHTPHTPHTTAATVAAEASVESAAQACSVQAVASGERLAPPQTATMDDSGPGGASSRRRKAQRACSHCQRAHLTCDDNRPCSRCKRRGLGATCVDGHKKRAKYLLDDPPNTTTNTIISTSNSNTTATALEKTPGPASASPTHALEAAGRDESHQASLGVSLSDTTRDSSVAFANSTQDPIATSMPVSLHAGLGVGSIGTLGMAHDIQQYDPAVIQSKQDPTSIQQDQQPQPQQQQWTPRTPLLPGIPRTDLGAIANMSSFFSSKLFNVDSPTAGLPYGGTTNSQLPTRFSVSSKDFGSRATNAEYDVLSGMLNNSNVGETSTVGMDLPQQSSGMTHSTYANIGQTTDDSADDQLFSSSDSVSSGADPKQQRAHGQHAGGTQVKKEHESSVLGRSYHQKHTYNTNLMPYDYSDSYHDLISYIRSRMSRDDIYRICHALTKFRPSFMAQIMHLSKEDQIFVEMSFQRALTEFERLISCSGTPTAVWRRTGEIALIGKEFSILTNWPKERLVNPNEKTYIYEVMDTQSAVEYWENFSELAFDNSRQSMMTVCTLLGSDGSPIPCTFCFTIKRDIFDVPLAIVGNFLPIFQIKA